MGACASLLEKTCVSEHDKPYEGLNKTQKDLLDAATYDNTQEFGLKNVRGWCKVVKVYDGDTVHIVMIIDGTPKRIKCRLSSIDAAEMDGETEEERKFAINGKDMMESLTKDRLVWAMIKGIDKYGGRYVTTLYPDQKENKDTSFNQIMLNEGLAYKYDGKTKKKQFSEWHKDGDKSNKI